jgi:hypothetical protein
VTLPGIGTVPILPGAASSVLPPAEVTSITNPGSIDGLLPVISPTASATAPTAGFVTSPAADDPASPAAADRTSASASDFVLIVPTATAEKIAVVVVLLMVALALRMRARSKIIPLVFPARAARGANSGPVPARRLKPSALLHLRRPRGESGSAR